MSATLHLHFLGDFLAVSGDTPLTSLSVPRQQSLLAYLVLHCNAPQDRTHLAFLLWPDSTEGQAHTNLRKLLFQLRQALPDLDHFLHANNRSLQWRASRADVSWTLDVLQFEQALLAAEQADKTHDTTIRRQELEQAVNYYRGDLLPSCYDEWILSERDRLRQLFLQAAANLLALLEQERDYTAAIAVAQRLLRQEPLHEATYRQLMRLHALRGDRATALRVYHSCVTALERELGIEPGAATRSAYEAILQAEGTAETRTGPLPARGTAAPLLGRKTEWRTLQEAWRKAVDGHPQFVVLSGEAGIGKTRLAEEMIAWAGRQGMATASACCYATEGRLAYAPVTTWLRADVVQNSLTALDPAWLTEIARLLPEALIKRPRLPRPIPMAEGWQRQLFFEAMARSLLNVHQPLLLLLDDLQWCDAETLEWLHYLLRFDPRAHLMLIGTVRSEEALPGHPLLTLLAALQRAGVVTEIALGPLSTSETTSLAEHMLGHPLAPSMSQALYAEAEGNPLFVVEMARARTLEGDAAGPSASSDVRSLLTQSGSTLPPTVQSVLETRLAQLSPQARAVANVAAVIGRAFSFPVLARVCAQEEDSVVRGLDELWQRRIVREQSGATSESYDFCHDKLRERAYSSLSPIQRRLLHRRVAEAFEVIYASDLESVSGQIAVHYERAGLAALAVPYYQRAGTVARRIYANAEAMHALEQAVALLEACTAGQNVSWETAAQVYESLGDVSTVMGHTQEAIQAYQQAMTCVSPQEFIWQARLRRKTANTWNQISENPLDSVLIHVRQAFQEAERILTHAADPSNLAWRREWIRLHFDQIWPLRWSAEEMTTTIEKVQPIVEQYGTQEQRVFLFYAQETRDFIRNGYLGEMPEEKKAFWYATLDAIQKTGNKSVLGGYRIAFGTALWGCGYLDEAASQLEMALQMGEQMGIVWLQTRCLTLLPFIYRRRGQVERVRDILTRAQVIGAMHHNSVLIGQRAWVAWRDGNLAEAETFGRASLEAIQLQSLASNLFHWVGVWPLLGVALAREQVSDAIGYARLLLAPKQQAPSGAIATLLAAALTAWENEKQEEARAIFRQVVPLAEEMGYL
ncbi:MAG TPA: AAA family ATPase [Ktedonosporobacter sp.]|nr:AAA family ATPase [Ktedonosporobacter sp.]